MRGRVACDLVLTSKTRQLEMHVGVDKARHHNAPFRIEPGNSTCLSINLGVRPHHNDSAVPDERGFGARMGSIHRHDSTIDEGQVVPALSQRLPGNNERRSCSLQEVSSSHLGHPLISCAVSRSRSFETE